MKREQLFSLVIIGVIFISLSLLKIYKVTRSVYYTKDESSIFWTEGAFQYRYARMVAMNRKIPIIDKKAEFPEGYPVKKLHPTLMEVTAGYLYRFMPIKCPFHIFLVFLMGFYSSISVIAVYLISSFLWENRMIGVFSSLLYSLTLSASMSVLNIGYQLQDFALPFIFLHIFFYLKAESVKDNRIFSLKGSGYSALSGAFLFISLASWHLTQFYYVVFLVYIMFRLLYDKNYSIGHFIVVSFFLFLAGFTIPILNPGIFFLSIPMLFTYCLIFTGISPYKVKWELLGSFILVFGAIFLLKKAGIYVQSGFNIIFRRGILPLIVEKIKGLGTRPETADKLLWETLVLWVHPLNNPTIKWTIKSFGVLFPAGIFSSTLLLINVIKKRSSKLFILPIFFGFVFLFSYLLFERIDVFLVLFLAILSGYFAKKWKMRGTIFILLLMIPNLLTLKNYRSSPPGPNRNYLLQVLHFIKYRTDPDSPILANFAYGPTILSWTGRPIIIHPKFESFKMVSKIKSFEHLLFKTEEEFYQFCKKNSVRYFLLSGDMLLSRRYSSIRYRTHNFKTSRETVIYKFHFQPDELRRFTLIYSNPHYRIFSVRYPDIPVDEAAFEYYRIYDEGCIDLSQFGIQ